MNVYRVELTASSLRGLADKLEALAAAGVEVNSFQYSGHTVKVKMQDGQAGQAGDGCWFVVTALIQNVSGKGGGSLNLRDMPDVVGRGDIRL